MRAFINVRASYAVNDSFVNGTTAADGPFNVALDYAIKVGGFDGVAIRGEAFYDDSNGGDFIRSFTQLVHDDFENAIRFTAGDLNIETTQFQGQPTLLGVSAERRYSDIQPFRQLQPGGNEEFSAAPERHRRCSDRRDNVADSAPSRRALQPARFRVFYGLERCPPAYP